MASATPFLLIPASNSGKYRPSRSTTTTATTTLPATSSSRLVAGPSSFKPPAHVHSHHLHSIPPRDKSTRSLILDQSLELSTSFRLAGVRAELGWGVLPCGAEPIEEFKHRHEFHRGFMLDDIAEMEVEDEQQRRAYADSAHRPQQLRVPNATLATSLYARAQGTSNVICATLSQPPPLHTSSSSVRPDMGGKLPNSVRFRIALAILVDQYFAPPLRPTSSTSSPDTESTSEIPLDLAPFVSLSSYRPMASPTLPPPPSSAPRSHLSSSQTQTQPHTTLPGIKSFLSSSSSAASPSPTTPTTGPFASFSAPGVSSRSSSKPFFFGSASRPPPPATHNKLPTFMPADSRPNSDAVATPVSIPTSMRLPNWTGIKAVQEKPTSMMSSSSSASSSLYSNGLATKELLCTRHLRSSCDSPGCVPLPRALRSSIGAGLDTRCLSSLSASTLLNPSPSSQRQYPHTPTVLANFLRLSALIQSELESESKSKSRKLNTPDAGLQREWYAIVCGLITRAVLEGYLVHGWKTTKGVEILFGFGGEKSAAGKVVNEVVESDDEDEDDEDAEGEVRREENDDAMSFEPDRFPSLLEAYKTLFPSTSEGEMSEYVREFRDELKRRRNEFLNPATTPSSLAAHLQSLNEKYKSESLDKLMILFCERVAMWRGEPELVIAERANGGAMRMPGRLSLSPLSNPSALGGGSAAVPASGEKPKESTKRREVRNELGRYFGSWVSLTSSSSSSSGSANSSRVVSVNSSPLMGGGGAARTTSMTQSQPRSRSRSAEPVLSSTNAPSSTRLIHSPPSPSTASSPAKRQRSASLSVDIVTSNSHHNNSGNVGSSSLFPLRKKEKVGFA